MKRELRRTCSCLDSQPGWLLTRDTRFETRLRAKVQNAFFPGSHLLVAQEEMFRSRASRVLDQKRASQPHNSRCNRTHRATRIKRMCLSRNCSLLFRTETAVSSRRFASEAQQNACPPVWANLKQRRRRALSCSISHHQDSPHPFASRIFEAVTLVASLLTYLADKSPDEKAIKTLFCCACISTVQV